MDLQMALSATQGPDYPELLFPGDRGTGPDALNSENRFGEYLQRALGDDGNGASSAAAETGAPETKQTKNKEPETAAQPKNPAAVEEESSATEGVREGGGKEKAEDGKSSSSNEEPRKGKMVEESSMETKNRKQVPGEKPAAGKDIRKPDPAEENTASDETVESGGSKEDGRTAPRYVEREVRGADSEEKSREASAVLSRGTDESGRGEVRGDVRPGGVETARKPVTTGSGESAGGDAGNKNTGDHKDPSFTIVDMRKSRGKEGAKNRTEGTDTHKGREVSGAGKETFKGTLDRTVSGEERSSDSAVRLIRPEGEPPVSREFTDRSPSKPGYSQEQQALFKSMRESGNGEIVKRAGIILRNDSSGEIRMDLKPEKLGKVRVQIHLKDNTLSGRIIVESSAVREVFESNMETLHRAFRESGFDSAQLDVQVGGGRQQEHQGSHKQRPRTTENIRSLEEHVSLTREAGYSDGVIDLVV